MNIGFLIPTTSKGKNWNTIHDSYLYKFTLTTLQKECSNKYQFIFFIGYDADDVFYKNDKIQQSFSKLFPKYKFRFIEFESIKKGHLTKMWNILYYKSLIDNDYFINYFYQCGDDIVFETQGWLEKSINILKHNNDIGISGPYNEHPYMLTQTLITRKHYDIFKCLFPEMIFNWGCDDWINNIYKPTYVNPVKNQKSINSGGPPRYNTSNYDLTKLKQRIQYIANSDKNKVIKYIE